MLLLFWWHSGIPNPTVDLGSRTCEFLFVASGFLVGYNYFYRDVPATWKESVKYASGKLIKFWPLHFIATMLVMLKTCSSLTALFSFDNCFKGIVNLSLLQAWSDNMDIFFSYNGASWFLSALIFCYFMSPILLNLSKDVKVSGVLFVIVFLVRLYIEYVFNINPEFLNFHVHVSPIVRCMDFFMGMQLVPIYRFTWAKEKDRQKTFFVFSIIEIVSCIVILSLMVIRKEWYKSVFVLLFCAIVFVFSFDKGILSMLLGTKPFKWFSSIQFEFFILHQAFIICLRDVYKSYMQDWRMENAVMFLTVLLAAFIYHKFLSKLFTNVMRKVFNTVFRGLNIDLTM